MMSRWSDVTESSLLHSRRQHCADSFSNTSSGESGCYIRTFRDNNIRVSVDHNVAIVISRILDSLLDVVEMTGLVNREELFVSSRFWRDESQRAAEVLVAQRLRDCPDAFWNFTRLLLVFMLSALEIDSSFIYFTEKSSVKCF